MSKQPKYFADLSKTTAIDGSHILTPDLKMHLLSLNKSMKKSDFDKIIMNLKENPWNTSSDAMYSLSIYDNARYNRDIEYEVYQKKVLPSENAPTCPRCGSTSVRTESVQTTSADEAQTIVSRCVCGKVFKPKEQF